MGILSGRRALIGAALAIALAPQAASAQAWIGQIAGDMVARQVEAQQRRDCMAQTGSAVVTWTSEGPKVDAVMKGFVTAAVNGDGKGLKALLSRRKEGGIRAADGTFVAPKDMRLPAGGELQRTLLAFELFGRSARGVWVQPAADPAGPPLYYAADFIKSFGGGWKIWRVAVSDAAPSQSFYPTDYCYGTYSLAPLW